MLGTDRNNGNKIMMFMHHSRNSREKECSETRAHVLQERTRVLSQFFVSFSKSGNVEIIGGFISRVDSALFELFFFCMCIQSSITESISEVASSAVTCLPDIF